MFTPSLQNSMESKSPHLLSQEELAERWGVSVVLIGLYSAVGLGPKYVREGGFLRFPMEEVQKYEHARRMH
jgi:predicted site-specific integrase-resolvase